MTTRHRWIVNFSWRKIVDGLAPCFSLLLIAGCAASSGGKTVDAASALGHKLAGVDDFQRVIEDAVPPGTSVEVAQRSLEEDGYECSLQRPSKAREADRNRDPNGPRPSPPFGDADYLYATKSERVGFMVSREYRVLLRIDEAGIAEIRANYGLVGP